MNLRRSYIFFLVISFMEQLCSRQGFAAETSSPVANDKPCQSSEFNPVLEIQKNWVDIGTQIAERVTELDLLSELKSIGSKNTDAVIDGYYVTPTSRTCSSITYDFEKELKLTPKHSAYLSVPDDLRNRSVMALLLDHRQDSRDGNNRYLVGRYTGIDGPPDESPGYTSFQVHMPALADGSAWRHYQSPWESGPSGGKFAEVKYDPERESMNAFRSYGHKGAHSGDVSKDPVLIDSMRLVSVGKDPVYIKSITMKVAPPPSDKVTEVIFTPGTKFENLELTQPPKWGGGTYNRGRYPMALSLPTSRYDSKVNLPKGWKLRRGDISIPLDPDHQFTGIEISVGDMHGPEVSGNALISVTLVKSGGEKVPLIENENIGKNDIIVAYPKDCNYVSSTGDQLVIHVRRDTAQIMGIRLRQNQVSQTDSTISGEP